MTQRWNEDPEVAYSVALANLKTAEREYAEAESKMIEARRRVKTAEVGTAYHRAITSKR